MGQFSLATRTAGRSALGLAGLLGVFTASCRCADDSAPKAVPSATASSAPSAARPVSSAPKPKPRVVAPGPVLAVLAGQGVGAIRFGATVATVERLMMFPCEVKTENACRYAARGIEFGLVNGVVDTVSIHRAGRPAGNDAQGQPEEYGFFRGAIPPDLRLGMLPKAVKEFLKEPERVEMVTAPNPNNTVERHFYPGLVIEYDKHTNGNLIMGGIKVVKAASSLR
jgi:hypothetical protein